MALPKMHVSAVLHGDPATSSCHPQQQKLPRQEPASLLMWLQPFTSSLLASDTQRALPFLMLSASWTLLSSSCFYATAFPRPNTTGSVTSAHRTTFLTFLILLVALYYPAQGWSTKTENQEVVMAKSRQSISAVHLPTQKVVLSHYATSRQQPHVQTQACLLFAIMWSCCQKVREASPAMHSSASSALVPSSLRLLLQFVRTAVSTRYLPSRSGAPSSFSWLFNEHSPYSSVHTINQLLVNTESWRDQG